jgi:hypothetical protein
MSGLANTELQWQMPDFNFTYNGSARWHLFFDTPNEAGWFLVSLVPLIWAVIEYAITNQKRVAIVAGSLVHVIQIYALDRTMSRGAFAALVASALMYFGLGFAVRNTRKPTAITVAIFVLTLAGVLAAGSLWQRFLLDTAAQDRSVLNRFEIWEGGLKMIAALPFGGWGTEGTGWHYAQWFRAQEGAAYANNLVSGILDFCAKQGTPILALVFFFLSTPISFALIRARNEPKSKFESLSIRACASVSTGFISANIFNSLYSEVLLTLVPAAGICVCLFLLLKAWATSREGVRVLTISAAFSVSVAFLLLVLAKTIQRLDGRSLAASEKSIRYVLGSKQKLVLAPDSNTLGTNYGWELRKALEAVQFDGEAEILFNQFPDLSDQDDKRGLVLFGRHAMYSHLAAGRDIYIIHPSCPLPKFSDEVRNRVRCVVVPTFLVSAEVRLWEGWAVENGIRLIRSPYGENITSVLPAYLAYALK